MTEPPGSSSSTAKYGLALRATCMSAFIMPLPSVIQVRWRFDASWVKGMLLAERIPLISDHDRFVARCFVFKSTKLRRASSAPRLAATVSAAA
jgi:hypothetical protein